MIRHRSLWCRVALAGVLASTVVAPVAAQLFGIVFDPENYANAVLRYEQLRQQFTELVMMYTQIRSQYELLVEQARQLPVAMGARYRTVSTPWSILVAPHRYGTTTGWVGAANTGQSATTAVAAATEAMGAYTDLSRLAADEAARVRTRYDRIELTDATVAHDLEALGTIRSHQPSVEQVVRNLESDAFSDASDFNTEIAVLNKINATAVTSARLTHDMNNILISLLEQQLIDAITRRDATVEGVNAHIAFVAEARPLLDQTTAHTTEALTAFRIP